jgi:manganese/zinc/iron transport system permease protein
MRRRIARTRIFGAQTDKLAMMCVIDIPVIILMLMLAYACTLLGVFLTLRGTALMSDAISHAVLPGIVGMFLYTQQLHSPLLLIAATGSGMLTLFLTEHLIRSRALKEDAAIGLIFPLFFSVGIILICLYARTVHLDIDMVIMGEIIFAPFNRWYFFDIDMGPSALWSMGSMLLANTLFVSFFFKELCTTTFDPLCARTTGFSPRLIHYLLMGLTGITCVGAFDIVGSIVVVALIVGPAATAYLCTHSLQRMLYFSLAVATATVALGYGGAYLADVSIAGSVATASGILFAFALLCAPDRGIIARSLLRRKKRAELADQLIQRAMKKGLSHAQAVEILFSRSRNL